MFYNLFPDPAPLLTNASPINFTLDQHPVGVNVGYTWASNYFKQVFAVSAKVTNGLNADGSEILFNSTKNSKDYWFDADYWFGPDGGVTFMAYHGTKDQVQNQGAAGRVHVPAQHPPLRRLRQLPVLRQTGRAGRISARAATTGRTSRAAPSPTSFRMGIAARWITTSSAASRSWPGTTA